MEKFMISYNPSHGPTKRIEFEGERDKVIYYFLRFLEEYLPDLPYDLGLYEYKLIQDWNPNVPTHGYVEIIRSEK